MLVGMFRVRLADAKSETGYRPGIVGTVVGEQWRQAENGTAQPIYPVLWFNYDEETGEETPFNGPAPSFHSPEELRAHVELDEVEELDEEEDEDEEESDTPQAASGAASRPPQGPEATL